MELQDLTGKTVLWGFDRFNDDRPAYEGAEPESVEVVHLGIGDCIIEISEDPNDGYRSGHNNPIKVNANIKNSFSPIEVICDHIVDGRDEYDDGANILRIRNATTSEIILDIGTDNVDDYYPSWVCEFSAAAIGKAKE